MGVLAVIAIAVIVNVTSPSEGGPAVVLVLLLSFYVVFVDLFLIVLRLVWRKKLGDKKELQLSLMLAFLPILVVGAHNFGGGWVIGGISSLLAVGIGCALVVRI